MKDLPKKRQVELHAYWPREAFSSAPSQGLNEDDLSNFKRVEIEIKADKVHAKVMIKMDFSNLLYRSLTTNDLLL